MVEARWRVSSTRNCWISSIFYCHPFRWRVDEQRRSRWRSPRSNLLRSENCRWWATLGQLRQASPRHRVTCRDTLLTTGAFSLSRDLLMDSEWRHASQPILVQRRGTCAALPKPLPLCIAAAETLHSLSRATRSDVRSWAGRGCARESRSGCAWLAPGLDRLARGPHQLHQRDPAPTGRLRHHLAATIAGMPAMASCDNRHSTELDH
jgi:hypothetical protein